MSWSPATEHCQNLTLGGMTDWRLPTIGELRTLVRGCPDTETDGSCNVVDDGCLSSNCQNGSCGGCVYKDGPADGCYWPVDILGTCTWYWSSSFVEDPGSDCAWYIEYHLAYVNIFCDGFDDVLPVRCVHSPGG